MKAKQFKVNDKWVMRDGAIATIGGLMPNGKIVACWADARSVFTEDGHYNFNKKDSEHDLMFPLESALPDQAELRERAEAAEMALAAVTVRNKEFIQQNAELEAQVKDMAKVQEQLVAALDLALGTMEENCRGTGGVDYSDGAMETARATIQAAVAA